MRKLLPVALVLIVGCGYGPARRRPGSDMVLPTRIGLTESLLRSLACSAQKRDSLHKTPAAATARDGMTATCGALRDTVAK
jgi:hypothetical protein